MRRDRRVLTVFLTVAILACMPMISAAINPPPVQFFYVPVPENQWLQALQVIQAGGFGETPRNPMQSYISISAIANNTIIYYDQYENGYEPDIGNPLDVYSSSNLDGTQIWGDGDTSNGVPPGVPSDIINGGTVIVLNNPVTTTDPLTVIKFGGRDKIAATKTISVVRAGWATGPNTLMADANEVYDTDNWGTEFRVPVGTNIPDGTDFQMFQYTGMAIMAGKGGATVQIDANADTVFETTVPLTEGQSYLVNNGLSVGARVISNNPVQVDLITGNIATSVGYESRFFRLLPTNLWAASYYTPVSTPTSAQTYNGVETTVWLYNPSSTAITVQYRARTSSSTISNVALTVPANSYLKQVLTNVNYGAHFYTTGGQKFYALSTTNSGNSGTSTNYYNSIWDWGFALVPESSLTPQLLIGLGIGRDPTSSTNPTENGNPVWVSPIGNGNNPVRVYVDFDANPTTGSLTDPNGNKYNVHYDLTELDRAKVYDTIDRDQTGMLLYTLDGTKLVGAWGEDPLTASAAAPGVDMGTGIPPLPLFDDGKTASLYEDRDNDGYVSPGDVLLYTIVINNIARAPVPDVLLQDAFPVDAIYVEDSTNLTKEAPTIPTTTSPIPDSGTTAFPLDEGGVILDDNVALPVGGSYTVTFKAIIKDFVDLTPGITEIVNTGSATAVGITIPFEARTPIYGRLGDYVWLDVNGNGIQDVGELGVANVTVNLLDGSGNPMLDVFSNPVTIKTNATGFYQFLGLLPGSYIVEFIKPTGYDFTLKDKGQDDAVDSDADLLTGRTSSITLAAGENNSMLDAGLFLKARTESGNYIAFYSSEWSNADQRPKLTVDLNAGSAPIAPPLSAPLAPPVVDNLPVADAGADKDATKDVAVTFDGSGSTDDNSIVSYSWDFGDTTTVASGVSPVHTYTTAGTYTVTLTVTDTIGQTGSDTLEVVVSDSTATTTTTDCVSHAPVYDNRLLQRSPDIVYSTNNYIDIGRSTSSYRDAILFDLSGYKPTDTISQATLSLYWYYPAGATRTSDTVVEVYRPVKWDPKYVTWNTRMSGVPWTTAGGDWFDKNGNAQGNVPYASVTFRASTVPDNKYYDFDVTQLVQEYVSGMYENTGFFLKARTESGNYIAFYSSEWSNADQRPQLKVCLIGASVPIAPPVSAPIAPPLSAPITPPVVDNLPVADAGADLTATKDVAVTFDGSNSTDDIGIVSYTWSFGDGTAESGGVSPIHTYVTAGTYTVTLTVTDTIGQTDSDTLEVVVSEPVGPVDNPPVADAGADKTATTGVAVTFDGSGSTDDNSIVSYSWDFGDGTAESSGVSPAHTYVTAGTYTVTLIVTDTIGQTGSDTLEVVVNEPVGPVDNPPVADAGADKTATTGVAVTFGGSGSTDDIGIVSYSWDFGDGTAEFSGVSPAHTYATAGTYTVTLIVTDTIGQTDSDTLEVVVNEPTTTTGSSVSYTAAYDNRLRQISPDRVYSTSIYLDIGKLSTSSYRDVILFDLSGYDPKDTISQATLSLYWYYPAGATRTSDTVVEVYRPVKWDPKYVTWNTSMSGVPWTTAGGDWFDKNGNAQGNVPYASVTFRASTVPDNKYYDFDVTQLVQEYIRGTYENTGFFLKARTESGNYIAFYSSEWSNTDQRPKLVVTRV